MAAARDLQLRGAEGAAGAALESAATQRAEQPRGHVRVREELAVGEGPAAPTLPPRSPPCPQK